jgi:hypothetical protein
MSFYFEKETKLDASIVNKAVALFEEIREKHGAMLHSEKMIILDLPLEREFACKAPDYKKILTVPQSYIVDYSCSGYSKFAYLHENGRIYYVYKNDNSMWVNLLQELNPLDISICLSGFFLPPKISKDLVTINF